MNKTALQQQIIATLEADREVARTVLAATHEAATHDESKDENKYETRGLEAAYLADGQRRRLNEIETDRKRVVRGKRVYERVDLGGGRRRKKKKKRRNTQNTNK